MRQGLHAITASGIPACPQPFPASFTHRTDYLVTGDHPAPSWNNSLYGKKIQQAQEYGRIPVLSEVLLAEGLKVLAPEILGESPPKPKPLKGEEP